MIRPLGRPIIRWWEYGKGRSTSDPAPRDYHEPAPVDGCRWIQLGWGEFALVDEDMFPLLSRYTWRPGQGAVEAHAMVDGYSRQIKMHHLVMGKPPKGMVIDHKNNHWMDNRRINLRVATYSENTKNRSRPRYVEEHWC